MTPYSWLGMSFGHRLREELARPSVAGPAIAAPNPDLPGIGLERLRLQLDPRFPEPAFAAFLRGLSRAGEIALDGAWARLPGHEVELTLQDEALWQLVQPLLGGSAGFQPSRVRDTADALARQETEVRRLLKRAGRMGKVHEVAHDHFFPAPGIGADGRNCR